MQGRWDIKQIIERLSQPTKVVVKYWKASWLVGLLFYRCSWCTSRAADRGDAAKALCSLTCWGAYNVPWDQCLCPTAASEGDFHLSCHKCPVSWCYQVPMMKWVFFSAHQRYQYRSLPWSTMYLGIAWQWLQQWYKLASLPRPSQHPELIAYSVHKLL